jgi:predicted HicB family RNase H-like nuclease
MVKKRKTSTSTNTIDDFISAARDNEPANPLLNESPKAPRKYKSIALQFNKYEFDRLEVAATKAGISKNAFIRNALEAAYKKQN